MLLRFLLIVPFLAPTLIAQVTNPAKPPVAPTKAYSFEFHGKK